MRRPDLSLAFAFLLGACGSAPEKTVALPPPPPLQLPPEPAAPAAPTAEKAPDPECISLAEHCTADGAAPIAIGSIASVQVPTGWHYAFAGKESVQIAEPGSLAILGFSRIEGGRSEVVWPALYALLGELEVTGVPPEAIDLKKPRDVWKAHGIDVRVWEVEKPRKRGASPVKDDPRWNGEAGALLVGLSTLNATDSVLAVGFLKRSAPTTLVNPIRSTFESLNADPKACEIPAEQVPTEQGSPRPQPLPLP